MGDELGQLGYVQGLQMTSTHNDVTGTKTQIEQRRDKTCSCHMRTTKAQISAFVVRCLDRIIPLLAIAEISRP